MIRHHHDPLITHYEPLGKGFLVLYHATKTLPAPALGWDLQQRHQRLRSLQVGWIRTMGIEEVGHPHPNHMAGTRNQWRWVYIMYTSSDNKWFGHW